MRMLTTDDEGVDIKDDESVGLNIDVPKGHASVFFSSGSWMIFPDEAWPRAIAAIHEERKLWIRPRTRAKAAPMKHTAKAINKLVERRDASGCAPTR